MYTHIDIIYIGYMHTDVLGMHNSIILGWAPFAVPIKFPSSLLPHLHIQVPKFCLLSLHWFTLLSQVPRILAYILHCSVHPTYPGGNHSYMDISCGCMEHSCHQGLGGGGLLLGSPWPLALACMILLFSNEPQIMCVCARYNARLRYLWTNPPTSQLNKPVPRSQC